MGGEKLPGRRAALHETPRQWGSLLRKEENQQRTRWKKSSSNDSSTVAALLFVKKAPKADPYD